MKQFVSDVRAAEMKLKQNFFYFGFITVSFQM